MTGRQENMEKHLNAIMRLKGAGELKSTIKRLHIFLENKELFSLTDITLPNYLWAAKRGCGVTTLAKAFTDYLHAAKAIEFCGAEKFFEFKLDYIAPESFFSELTRLDTAFSAYAKHHRYFKGVFCVDIDEWLDYCGEDHFLKFLDYIASNNNRILVIFVTYTDNKNKIGFLESTLAMRMRLESLSVGFPETREFVAFTESKFMDDKGFSFTKNAKALLSETIESISGVEGFRGFKSVEQLADDILFNVLTTNLNSDKQISEEMLASCIKDYAKRVKFQIGAKNPIGFTERSV